VPVAAEAGVATIDHSQLPIQHVAGWAGFVAGSQLLGRPQLANQSADRLRPVGNDPQGSNFAVRFRDRDGNGFCMDIQTHKSYSVHRTDPLWSGPSMMTSIVSSFGVMT